MPDTIPTGAGERLCAGLRDARRRQLAAFEDLSGAQLLGERGHGLEPPIWEMGHVAWFQELWLLRHLDGAKPMHAWMDRVYDSFRVSYRRRWEHDFPSRDETLAYAGEVLARCQERIEHRDPTPDERFLYELAAQHEYMHTENLIAVRQTLGYASPCPQPAHAADVDAADAPRDVEIPDGAYRVGAERGTGFVHDNEKWAHETELEAFAISSMAVTNAEFARFVDAGGYGARAFWDKRGWEWRRRSGAEAPLFWEKLDGVWHERRFDRVAPIDSWHPACHVNWHEARAYCRFAGRRLPTEAEWEVAAAWDPKSKRARIFPWGKKAPDAERANVGGEAGGVVDVRALGGGDSPFGCRQMIGNVWEWTDSVLAPYPGFEPDPYAEYSAPYFGKKPVLKGGAWTSHPRLVRNTWRNFFMRQRRNVFAGFRTCRVG